ncbi:conserved hypothetical protein [Microsporum canis CBS 113480]|uniref:Uncharacterized protein n=1 Tax=Arthroderma otae (strain ATCC MYA-4605 / CBS 113480) TaxID=554155 RepID=C5FZ60_ARTOC|nr:conserved hypothetical protein [Microsporum canis CBS 113480]EEQ35163.1 conserved hypothetical protein [Microsporum canis CBS 113480]
MSNLRQDIIAELEQRRMELQELMTRQAQLYQFITDLRMRMEELEQLTTKEIAQYEQELNGINIRIRILESAIELLSQS